MSQLQAELWSTRIWNQPIGRIAYWLRKNQQHSTYTGRQWTRALYTMACEATPGGPLEVQRQLLADHGVRCPDWLHVTERQMTAEAA